MDLKLTSTSFEIPGYRIVRNSASSAASPCARAAGSARSPPGCRPSAVGRSTSTSSSAKRPAARRST